MCARDFCFVLSVSFKAELKRTLKSASLSNYFHNTEAVYIDENLRNYRRDLFAKVRKFKKNNNWHSAWTMDGKIFIKKSQSDQVKRIYEAKDLRNICEIATKTFFPLPPQYNLCYALPFTPRFPFASLIILI